MSCITHFRTELRIKVDAVEAELDSLAARIARGEASAELLIRTQLQHLSRHLECKRDVRIAAADLLKQCGSNHDEASATTISERSRCVHFQDPDGWAACARNRACAAMDLVAAAIDEAAYAALEAWLAEKAARARPVRSRLRGEHGE